MTTSPVINMPSDAPGDVPRVHSSAACPDLIKLLSGWSSTPTLDVVITRGRTGCFDDGDDDGDGTYSYNGARGDTGGPGASPFSPQDPTGPRGMAASRRLSPGDVAILLPWSHVLGVRAAVDLLRAEHGRGRGVLPESWKDDNAPGVAPGGNNSDKRGPRDKDAIRKLVETVRAATKEFHLNAEMSQRRPDVGGERPWDWDAPYTGCGEDGCDREGGPRRGTASIWSCVMACALLSAVRYPLSDWGPYVSCLPCPHPLDSSSSAAVAASPPPPGPPGQSRTEVALRRCHGAVARYVLKRRARSRLPEGVRKIPTDALRAAREAGMSARLAAREWMCHVLMWTDDDLEATGDDELIGAVKTERAWLRAAWEALFAHEDEDDGL